LGSHYVEERIERSDLPAQTPESIYCVSAGSETSSHLLRVRVSTLLTTGS
jgi:hypothetical protein